ncbi:group III truncated hemoglobin [Flaviaesturariibacter flavus]|uniref:Group III truncated hemoglobin n=1 Tax=Flaviaesturariibacter flavus TaxID=2502780 RepID=A0A4R1BBC6_9BACT|nr:group III truncated hemoglobin [Flaviaesturariibacter flavus]TCJ14306.1 group III truncated hemoglobin [Flaviaesturariibacter flavus]
MKRDIETRKDIEDVLTAFYADAFSDDLIGRFFTEVVPLNLETHLPVIADFWESILFNTPYTKNVMAVHQHIHHLSAIRKEHLDRWVQLFTATVAARFEGPRATLLQQRGRSVATLMDIKLNHPKKGI